MFLIVASLGNGLKMPLLCEHPAFSPVSGSRIGADGVEFSGQFSHFAFQADAGEKQSHQPTESVEHGRLLSYLEVLAECFMGFRFMVLG